MQKSTTRQKRQLENLLREDFWYDDQDARWDSIMAAMHLDWQSDQCIADGETVCEVQQEGELVVLLHHGRHHIEAANSLPANMWFGLEPDE